MTQSDNSDKPRKWGMKSFVFNSVLSTAIGSAVGYYAGFKVARRLHSNQTGSESSNEREMRSVRGSNDLQDRESGQSA